ncbi:TIR domain-containing protein [Leptolyngbya iicbica]|uniref:TIR domain-containing protein n=2 Tax=Cyanophyceae TaxID=3028117 RepID=A0A4V2E3C4_9CYAN|nr:TIR domain-containing protein [Leptolyngbya sp. LK]RZM81950.1 TIR domain-containing protein [Leptolyngbya sp. LK]
MSTKRFRVAFSFAGEKRAFVERVAALLADCFGEAQILYDKYCEAEFARYDLGIYLPRLYSEQSDLIVPVLCSNYDQKHWTGWEWVHIYGLLTKTDGERVMPCRFDYATADGLSPVSGFVELDNKTPEQLATLILERLAVNEHRPKDYYTCTAKFVRNDATSRQPSVKVPYSNLPQVQPSFERDTTSAHPPTRDFFISYTKPDRAWAEWIGWMLEEAGYTIFIDVWDFRPGSNFSIEMDKGTQCRQTIAVLTQNYLKARYTKPEWAAAFADDPEGDNRKFIPIRVEDFNPSGLLKSIVYVDFVGVDSHQEARQRLLNALKERGKPDTPPIFPGDLNLDAALEIAATERAKPDSQPSFPALADRIIEQTANPFLPLYGGIEEADQFFNCESLLKTVFELLNTNHNLALIGKHNSGKSSLLRAIVRQAPKRLTVDRAPIYLDLTNVFAEEDFFEDLCEAIGLEQLEGKALVRKLNKEKGKHKYLLLLDEVERFCQEGFTRRIREQLHGIANTNDSPIKLVIAARVSLDQLFPDSNQDREVTPIENICMEQGVPAWTEVMCREFIINRLNGSPFKFSDQEIAQLVKGSDGNPQQLIQTCHELYNQYRMTYTELEVKQEEQVSQTTKLPPKLPHGAEKFTMMSILAQFQQAKTASEIAALGINKFPIDLLHPITWKAMQRFGHVISDTKTAAGSASRTSKAFSSNRALGELQNILDYIDDVPEAERGVIEEIVKQWRNALLDMATSGGEQTITTPVQNPYIVGDPVEGNLFVGREDVLRQLEELWLMGQQMQSVVLYGHRRMGKTSILRNAAKTVGAGLRLVYVNMLRSASAESISDVLLAITDELAAVMNVPPPSDEEMMAQPMRTCDCYLKRILDNLSNDETLIIAIDEFEKIEELIDTGKLAPDFIAYLRGLVQMSPKLGFAFAGLHTLEEMTQDYFNPFFASVIPIKVGFLQPGAVHQLLANPGGEFLLDYDRAALDLIYQLTSGQPYLTQLVGFQLVRRYNNLVFEQGREQSAIFTVADVDTVTTDPEFFQLGRYYFTGVWDQAGLDVPEQRPVLTALAPHPDGLSLDDLAHTARLSPTQLTAALTRLDRHDVVTVDNNQARIRVELFRRWLQQQQPQE